MHFRLLNKSPRKAARSVSPTSAGQCDIWSNCCRQEHAFFCQSVCPRWRGGNSPTRQVVYWKTVPAFLFPTCPCSLGALSTLGFMALWSVMFICEMDRWSIFYPANPLKGVNLGLPWWSVVELDSQCRASSIGSLVEEMISDATGEARKKSKRINLAKL